MRNKSFLIQLLCSFCFIVKFGYSQADVVSTFDVDDEGWNIVEFPAPPYDALASTPFLPNYLATGGNPDGAISSTDRDGKLFLFSAPSTFLGDMESFYGGSLSYDLRFVDNNLVPGTPHPDVILWGNGSTITIDFFSDPNTQTGLWESYSVSLTEAAGWHFDNLSGALASEAEIRGVLADLTGLYIRGDYWSGIDQTDLDNPRLSAVPLPPAVWLLGSGLIGLIGVARRKKA